MPIPNRLSVLAKNAEQLRKPPPSSVATALAKKLATSPRVATASARSENEPENKPEPAEEPSQLDRLTALQANSRPHTYADISRICALPISRPLVPGTAEFEAFCESHILSHAFNRGFRFFGPQATAIRDFELHGGFLAPIGVGWGKTLITLACASTAISQGKRKVLLIVPSSVYAQLVERDVPFARNRIPFSAPVIGLGGRTEAVRRQLAKSGRKGLYVLPYSCLSTKDAVDVLEAISPELILLDEAHSVKARRAARTRRLMDWIKDHSDTCTVACLSGTLTSKSIMDYHHLARVSLRERTPLPLSTMQAGEWSAVIDSGAPPTQALKGNPIEPLVKWAVANFPDMASERVDVTGIRKAYQLRLLTTPGVIATGDQDIGVSLVLKNEPIKDHDKHPNWKRLDDLIRKVDELWETPNGDEIDFAIHLFKWLYELSAGFYNELTWPTPAQLAHRRQITEVAAEDLLLRARAHHAFSQPYAKRLRDFLLYESYPGVDTPMLVGAEIAHKREAARVPRELRGAWMAMHEADFEGRPERDSRAVRVCSFRIDAAIETAKQWGSGGIIWYFHNEVGKWLHDAARTAGLDTLYCPAGDEANAAICDPSNQDKVAIASLNAHGTGKNLQHFFRQVYAQWPRSAVLAEQSIGRTHRNGQNADELIVQTLKTLPFDDQLFAACLNDSVYIGQTTTRSKIVVAGYDPLPKIYSHAFLRSRGFDPKTLDKNGSEVLVERFGDALNA